jgi:hypothetical protein
MGSTLDLLRRLVEQRVDFVLVGGMAATAHGSSVVTEDVDVCTRFQLKNLERLLKALEGLHPFLRMSPGRRELASDASALVGWKNLYLVTDWGQIDFLGEITGVGDFGVVARDAIAMDLGGFSCRVMSLTSLIRSKHAIGRYKDLRAARELELLLAHLKVSPEENPNATASESAGIARGPTGLSAEVGAICEAIRTHLRLKFLYGGKRRLVEPYCHGTSTTGAEVLRAVQVGSRSKRSRPGVGKLWLVAEMSDLTLAEPFSPSDPNYKPNDRAMKIVHCRI